MKKRNIDKGFIVALMYIAGVVLLIIGLIKVQNIKDIEFENVQNFRVVRLNPDKNSVKDEEAYFFGYDDVIYRYDFETRETERVCESYKNTFVIYEDYVFCVEKSTPENSEYSEYKVKRYNYHTGKDEILLENMPEIDDINVCNDYLVYKIYGESNYYLYPVTGNAEEEPIAVQSIFKERGDKTDLDIQTVTYEGIDIVGRFSNEAGEVEYISLKDESSGMELLPREAVLLLDDGRLIWFNIFGDEMLYVDNYDDLEECELLTLMGEGSISIGSDSERYEVECLKFTGTSLGLYGAVFSRNMIQDGDEIICLLRSADTVYNEYTNEKRVTVKGDVLFKWNMKTGESSILYASLDDADAYTRVIGYKDGDIYLLHNRWVLVQSVDGDNQKRLFEIPGRRERYSFDWQGDYLIVTGADGKVLKAYKTE